MVTTNILMDLRAQKRRECDKLADELDGVAALYHNFPSATILETMMKVYERALVALGG